MTWIDGRVAGMLEGEGGLRGDGIGEQIRALGVEDGECSRDQKKSDL